MFCPDGKANRARIDFLFRQFLGVELRMGGASRMDNQRFHVRYVRQQGEYLQIIDKAVRFLLPAPYLEREDRSCSGNIAGKDRSSDDRLAPDGLPSLLSGGSSGIPQP